MIRSRLLPTLLASVLLGSVVSSAVQAGKPKPLEFLPTANDPIIPDPQKTPGSVMSTDVSTVCHPGYSKTVRHTSGRLKHDVYVSYGINPHGGHYEIDHLIPLSIGGADVQENLWPESYDTAPWNAHVKDRLELKLLHLVCHGSVQITEAQRTIAVNWIAAYEKYCPTEYDCPSYNSIHSENHE